MSALGYPAIQITKTYRTNSSCYHDSSFVVISLSYSLSLPGEELMDQHPKYVAANTMRPLLLRLLPNPPQPACTLTPTSGTRVPLSS